MMHLVLLVLAVLAVSTSGFTLKSSRFAGNCIDFSLQNSAINMQLAPPNLLQAPPSWRWSRSPWGISPMPSSRERGKCKKACNLMLHQIFAIATILCVKKPCMPTHFDIFFSVSLSNCTRVLVRVDVNVPLKDGKITDDTRIRGAMPTIEYLKSKGAKTILTSHLGRPKGKEDKFSLAPVPPRISELLGAEVRMHKIACNLLLHFLPNKFISKPCAVL